MAMPIIPEQAWQSVLGQLQMEMPKASFDTWVRDTRVESFEAGVLKISTRNGDTRDWLESRLASTVRHLLVGILNQSVEVEFVVGREDNDLDDSQDGAHEDEADIQVVNRLEYDEIVTPSKVVAIPGYLSRLIPEIGARNAWLYVGWRQAVWNGERGNQGGTRSQRVAVKNIIRFSGLSRRTFFRAIQEPSTWEALSGLVERQDTSPRWAQGRDHRSHRLPNRYTVHMTLRLSREDGRAVVGWLDEHMRSGTSLLEALKQALEIKDLVGDLLPPIGISSSIDVIATNPQTVMDIARSLHELDNDLPLEIQEAAEALHRKITSGFGTILLTHYFLETVIPRSGLTPPQAWLVALLRDRCYLNPQTGEVRDEVLARGGYAELASWIGLSRPKTIWEWVRDSEGGVGAFVALLPRHEKDEFDALRFRVRLDEPLFDGATGTNTTAQAASMEGEDDTLKRGATGTYGPARVASMNGEDGTPDWREWHGLKHLNTASNTNALSTSTNQSPAAVLPTGWVLRKLLIQNHAHPRITKELLSASASAQGFVSWLLFACSPAGEGIDDPVAYAIASLREDPSRGAGGSFDRLAAMKLTDLIRLLDSAPKDRLSALSGGTGNTTWDSAMGIFNSKLDKLRKILLGE